MNSTATFGKRSSNSGRMLASYSSSEIRGRIVPCSPNKILLSETTNLRPCKRLLPFGFQTGYLSKIGKQIQEIDNLLPSGEPPKPFFMDIKKAEGSSTLSLQHLSSRKGTIKAVRSQALIISRNLAIFGMSKLSKLRCGMSLPQATIRKTEERYGVLFVIVITIVFGKILAAFGRPGYLAWAKAR